MNDEEYGRLNSAKFEKLFWRRTKQAILFFLLVFGLLFYKDCTADKTVYASYEEIKKELESAGIPISALTDSTSEMVLPLVPKEIKHGIVGWFRESFGITEEKITFTLSEGAMKDLLWDSAKVVNKFADTKRFKSAQRVCFYINSFQDIAVLEYQKAVAEGRNPVPPSLAIGQAILETGIAGRYSGLARTANNHHGIKCGKSWSGDTYYAEDDDFDKNGNKINSCFRRYHNPAQSYEQYYRKVMDNERYRWMSKYEIGGMYTDSKLNLGLIGENREKPVTYCKAWCVGVQQSKYATSKTYAAKVLGIINTYELWRIDVRVLNNSNSLTHKNSDDENSTMVNRTNYYSLLRLVCKQKTEQDRIKLQTPEQFRSARKFATFRQPKS